jgi:hypothetical protein
MIMDAAEVLRENGLLAPVAELGTNGSVDAAGNHWAFPS